MISNPQVSLEIKFPPHPPPTPRCNQYLNLFFILMHLHNSDIHRMDASVFVSFIFDRGCHYKPLSPYQLSSVPPLAVLIETYQVIKCASDETSLALPSPPVPLFSAPSRFILVAILLTELHSLTEYISKMFTVLTNLTFTVVYQEDHSILAVRKTNLTISQLHCLFAIEPGANHFFPSHFLIYRMEITRTMTTSCHLLIITGCCSIKGNHRSKVL